MEMLEGLGYPLPSRRAMPLLEKCRAECPLQPGRAS
jgi:hypothetical protein